MNNRRFLHALSWKLKMQLQSWLLYRFGSDASRRIEAVRQSHAAAFEAFQFRYDFRDPVNIILSSENLLIDQNMKWYERWINQFGQRVEYTQIDSTHDRLLYDPEAKYLAQAFVNEISKVEGRVQQ